MKKLMIAAAAAAMIGGVYASDECPTCGQGDTETTYNPAFYDVTFKLKTLTPKKVMCGQCELYCMEQGNRTLNGLYWTCDNCYNGTENKPGYQFALWEKAAKICYGNQVVYDRWNATKGYSVTGTYQTTGETWFFIDYKTNDTYTAAQAKADFLTKAASYGVPTPITAYDEKYVQYGYDEVTGMYVKSNLRWMAVFSKSAAVFTKVLNNDGKYYGTEDAAITAAKALSFANLDPKPEFLGAEAKVVTSDDGDCYWVANDSPFDASNGGVLLRYGKNGEKVEAYAKETQWADFAGNYGDMTLAFAGFGTYDTKNLRIKSISGYAVGLIDPNAICGIYGGQYVDLCDEVACTSSECWSESGVGADENNTAFTGTWTMKLNSTYPKKGMEKIVPAYVLGTGTCSK